VIWQDEDNERQRRLEEELEEYHAKVLSDQGFDYDLKKERYHGALALATCTSTFSPIPPPLEPLRSVKRLTLHAILFMLLVRLAENAAHIKKISDLKAENRSLKAEKEALQFKLDDEVYAASSWKREKDRFEMGLGSASFSPLFLRLSCGNQLTSNSSLALRSRLERSQARRRDIARRSSSGSRPTDVPASRPSDESRSEGRCCSGR
jgi:hypothetical protein